MPITYHRLWKLVAVICGLNIVCTLVAVLRPMLPLTDVKLTRPTPEPLMPEPPDDGIHKDVLVDYALVRETKEAEPESRGLDDVKILMHNPDVCKDLPGKSNCVCVCVRACVRACVRVCTSNYVGVCMHVCV